MSKKWKVPAYWTMRTIMEVEADTLEDAIYKVQTDDGPLPTDGEYLDGSWEADSDDIECIRDLYNNGQEDEKDEDE